MKALGLFMDHTGMIEAGLILLMLEALKNMMGRGVLERVYDLIKPGTALFSVHSLS